MKLSSGTDLAGLQDPQSANLGIIYVAPKDSRQEILTALTTMERLGRKQIALVLPEQQKAFHAPIDFDGLKRMRRSLKAEIVVITRPGPGPGEFARQRRFAVYPSLDVFVRILQNPEQQEDALRRRFPFLRTRPAALSERDGEARTQMPERVPEQATGQIGDGAEPQADDTDELLPPPLFRHRRTQPLPALDDSVSPPLAEQREAASHDGDGEHASESADQPNEESPESDIEDLGDLWTAPLAQAAARESGEAIIYLSSEEGPVSVRERLEAMRAQRILLVVPTGTQLRSHVGWRLLRAKARELRKDILVISADRQVRAVAKAAGLKAVEHEEAFPEALPKGRRRPGGRPRRPEPARRISRLLRTPTPEAGDSTAPELPRRISQPLRTPVPEPNTAIILPGPPATHSQPLRVPFPEPSDAALFGVEDDFLSPLPPKPFPSQPTADSTPAQRRSSLFPDEEDVPLPPIRPARPRSVPLSPPGAGAVPSPPRRRPGRLTPLPPPVSRRRRPGRKPLFIALLLVVLLLLALGYVAYSVRLLPGSAPAVTVTITPAKADLKNTYLISAMVELPDVSQRQVQARIVSYTTTSQIETVKATGVGHIQALPAQGSLTFYNALPYAQTIAAGTILMDANGIEVTSDASVLLPAARPPIEGVTTVPAHAANPGTGGNIPALDFNNLPCCTAGITVQNAKAFSGGRDQQDYAFVQQSDIDSVVNAQKASLLSAAQAALKTQIHANERLLGPVQCTPTILSDHSAGDRATSLTIATTVTCSGEVYDQQGALSMAAALLLHSQAATNFGAGYVLMGKISTKVMQTKVIDTKRNTITLLVDAAGVLVYQFDPAQKLAFAKLIAGKSADNARSLLLQQIGVARVDVQISWLNGTTLPADARAITIAVQSLSAK